MAYVFGVRLQFARRVPFTKNTAENKVDAHGIQEGSCFLCNAAIMHFTVKYVGCAQ